MCACVPRPPLRGYLLDGSFFIGGVIAGTLTKIAIRYAEKVKEPRSQNVSSARSDVRSVMVTNAQMFMAEAMLIVSSILHLGKSGIPKKVWCLHCVTSKNL